MNPYLEKLNFSQLIELFLQTTKEFVSALETESSYKELNYLRKQIRMISEGIEKKRAEYKHAC